MFISGFCRTIAVCCMLGALLRSYSCVASCRPLLDEEVLQPGQLLLPALAVPAGDVGFVRPLDDPDQRVRPARSWRTPPAVRAVRRGRCRGRR